MAMVKMAMPLEKERSKATIATTMMVFTQPSRTKNKYTANRKS